MLRILAPCIRTLLCSQLRGLCIDNSGDTAILSAMFGMRFSRFSARSGVSQAGASVILALWCLLSLTIEATRAHCLEVGRECPAPTAAAAGNCHDQDPDRASEPSCGTCVDVLIPADASAKCNRPNHDLRAPVAATAHPLVAAHEDLVAMADSITASATHLIVMSPLHPVPRTTVLRI